MYTRSARSRPTQPGGLVFRILFLMAVSGTGTLRAQQADCSAMPDSTPIQQVGSFSNMRFTEEHAYGYTIDLWRAGKCLFGLLEVAQGLVGDTPTGALSPLQYNQTAGSLVFAAKLTTGVTKPKNATDWVPSRELFQFSGHLGARALKGKLERWEKLQPELPSMEEEVVLPLSRQQQEFMIPAVSYGEWRKQAELILRSRGPKW